MDQNKSVNITFFRGNKRYQSAVENLDSYQYVAQKISLLIGHARSILDMGNGGFINYAIPKSVKSIKAVDICIKKNHQELVGKTQVFYQKGNILSYQDKQKYDLVIMQNFLHHVVGLTVAENYKNLDLCLKKTYGLLAKDGRLLIMESVVPDWLEALEKVLYQPARYFIPAIFKHPTTFQYSRNTIKKSLLKLGSNVTANEVKHGRLYLILGKKLPVLLTPVRIVNFNLEKVESH